MQWFVRASSPLRRPDASARCDGFAGTGSVCAPVVLLGLLFGLALPATGQVRYVTTDSSRFVIEGRTNVNQFTCLTRQVDGYGVVPERSGVRRVRYPPVSSVEARLTVPVRSLECGRDRMNRDLNEALRADANPEIVFELAHMSLQTELAGEGESHRMRVQGRLTVADSTRSVQFQVSGRLRPDGRLHGAGSTDLQMTDFGIEPPSAMLGLVNVEDEITVRFEVTAEPAPRGEEAVILD